MSNINLLPLDLSPNRRALKVASSIKMGSFLLLGIFLIVGTLAVVFIIFLRAQINSSVAKQSVISQSIRSLDSTEQKLFLTKDRIGKIKLALSDSNRVDSFVLVNKTLSNLSDGVLVYNVRIDANKTQFSVLSKNSLAMAQFLSSLVTGGNYKNLSLTGFTFSPDRGYLITLESS